MEPEQLISEIKQIMDQYKREVPKGRRAWPEAVKSRVSRLREVGISNYKIANAIDIPYLTLRSWEKGPGDFRKVKVRKALIPSTVQPSTDKPITVEGSSSIAITHSSGLRVEGLTFDQTIEILQRLVR